MSDIDTRLVSMLDSIPYARFLGIKAELAGDEMTAILPFAQHIVGNPMLPAIHGGVLGAFMEMTALAQLSVAAPMKRQPRTIDVSIERLGTKSLTYAFTIHCGDRQVATGKTTCVCCRVSQSAPPVSI